MLALTPLWLLWPLWIAAALPAQDSAPAGPLTPTRAVEPQLAPITLEALASELADRRWPTRSPSPGFAARFATTAAAQLEFEGPGALVRLASAQPIGSLRIFVDGSEQPVVDEPLAELMLGTGSLPPTFAASHPGGASVLLPVPFAKRCRVTADAAAGLAVQWRSYDPGTRVESLSPGGLARARPALEAAADSLGRVEYGLGAQSFEFGKVISYSGTGGTSRWNAMSIGTGDSGPHVVSELRIGPLTADSPEQLEQLLRRTILSITFDGVETVHTPLGDFFGAAPGLAPHGSPALTVSPDGFFTCRWPMPYRDTCFIRIEAQMDLPFGVPGQVTVEPREWTEDTLYFHANWRHEPFLETPPARSWTLLEVAGRGVLVGESLTVGSRDGSWRAGRARIVADGAGHRSRGVLEGLALPVDSSEPWWTPFASAPRCTGPGAEADGWTSLVRTRGLDAVPFSRELRYELGVDFAGVPLRSYAATTWFYTDADARVERGEVDELAGFGIAPPD